MLPQIFEEVEVELQEEENDYSAQRKCDHSYSFTLVVVILVRCAEEGDRQSDYDYRRKDEEERPPEQ